MSAHRKSTERSQPIVDEWGFYDPERAGLAAVMARLEERAPQPNRIWGAKKDDSICNPVKNTFKV